jgi:hypothetical protein
MAHYRLYILDEADHILRREEFELPDDQQALTKAKQFVDGKALELWSGAKRIARIEPEPGS